ncbi:POU domain, class 4, transcription factor 3-like isoform X1 [Montipora capricornis]|uniref:POU domain, class 4, transcription factor 3-like isoform X1 n=2 Tax=Montipora foliosa TaxID=591990 RepID=UPI0035F124C5
MNRDSLLNKTLSPPLSSRVPISHSNGISYSNSSLSGGQMNEPSWIPSIRGSTHSLSFPSRSNNLIPPSVFDGFDDSHLLSSSQLEPMPKYLSTKPNKPSSFTSLHSYHSTHGHDTSTYDAHDILDQISASLQPTVSESAFDKPFETPSPVTATPVHSLHSAIHSAISVAASSDDVMNPRELEWFAERFKQRRIKLGVTQADVGAALAHLKIPGVGSLSQSTICRFESLTLSHNNMMALKPVLTAWLEEAEKAYKCKNTTSQFLPNSDKKRKRTSIGAAEKRSLEAYFAMNPRPSSDKIASIAEKLDLSKNVVRVWFCNQRQKKKRMKFSVH